MADACVVCAGSFAYGRGISYRECLVCKQRACRPCSRGENWTCSEDCADAYHVKHALLDAHREQETGNG